MKPERLPFSAHLDAFPKCIKSCKANGVNENAIAGLASVIVKNMDKSFVFVGSGGSKPIADASASLCDIADIDAVSMTPLEFLMKRRSPDSIVFLFSASGANEDAKMVVSQCDRDGLLCNVITCTDKSVHLNNASIINFQPGHCGKSFIATESAIISLTGFLMALMRVRELFDGAPIGTAWSRIEYWISKFDELRAIPGPIESHDFDRIIIIHDPIVDCAGSLIETTMHEQNVLPVQICDYRNFAHGRHTCFKSDNLLTISFRTNGMFIDLVHHNLFSNAPNIANVAYQYEDHEISPWHAILDAYFCCEAISGKFGIELTKANTIDNARNIYSPTVKGGIPLSEWHMSYCR